MHEEIGHVWSGTTYTLDEMEVAAVSLSMSLWPHELLKTRFALYT